MCTEANEYDPQNPNANPLYKCDFYNSAAAGKALKSVLQKGESQPWQDTLQEFLCDPNDDTCVGEMDPDALLRYFAPIENWLDENQAENNWEIGWDNSEWKPCNYEDGVNPCPMTETCSEEEDWDSSWGPSVDPPEPSTDAPGSAVNILGIMCLPLSILFMTV